LCQYLPCHFQALSELLNTQAEKGHKNPISWEIFDIKPKFPKNIPMSNHDLIEWCKHLRMPINDVLSRDQTVPHNHKPALFIYNLEPS